MTQFKFVPISFLSRRGRDCFRFYLRFNGWRSPCHSSWCVVSTSHARGRIRPSSISLRRIPRSLSIPSRSFGAVSTRSIPPTRARSLDFWHRVLSPCFGPSEIRLLGVAPAGCRCSRDSLSLPRTPLNPLPRHGSNPSKPRRKSQGR